MPENQMNPDDNLSRLLAPDTSETPWYKSLYENISELINPPKLPPLEVTSKPVAVKDIWGQYGRQKKSWAMSLGMQSFVVLLLFTVFSAKAIQEKAKEFMPIFMPDIAPYEPCLLYTSDAADE